MLWLALEANGGRLPNNYLVAFANTGKERAETLNFVHECGARWGVPINWLEWRNDELGHAVVSYETAARNGEPFAALIAKKKRLPNWQERWCTQFLKVEPMLDFAAWSFGADFCEMIGIRHDEPMRIMRGLENADKRGRSVVYPLSRAKITRRDVLAFWKSQPFDLGLAGGEGNCDLCFMKGRGLRKAIIRDNPAAAGWWMFQEALMGGQFDRRDSFGSLMREIELQPAFDFGEADLAEDYDVECGNSCGVA